MDCLRLGTWANNTRLSILYTNQTEMEPSNLSRSHKATAYNIFNFRRTSRVTSHRLKAHLRELTGTRQKGMLLQGVLFPLLRITPLLLELGDDILVRVRVEFGVREEHTEDGAPSAVEGTGNLAG